jgi:hypothetical protein
MVSNPHFYGQSTTGTPNQIEDGVDFPHTGIIKALADGLGQNYGISGFDITTDSATQIDVGAGVIFRDGKRHEITAVPNLTLGRTNVNENSYHLVVVDKDNAIAIRSPSAKDKVAGYTVRTLTSGSSTAHVQGDTIIAVVTHDGNDPMPIQYLTVDKAENSLSIGYSNSGTYTESGKITGDADSLDIVSSITNADINITPNGNGKIVLDGLNWPIADGSANQVLKTDGGGQLSFVAQTSAYSDANAISAVEGEATLALSGDVTIASNKTLTIDSDLELSVSSNDVVIKNTNQDNDMIFKVNDGGSDTEVMRIDGDVARVGIGTATPSEKLTVSGNIRSSGDVVVGAALDHNGSNISFFATAAATKQTVGNMGTSAVGSLPAADPTLIPGFEPGNHAYIGTLEAEIGNLRTKLDALIDALQLYGLIS